MSLIYKVIPNFKVHFLQKVKIGVRSIWSITGDIMYQDLLIIIDLIRWKRYFKT